MIRLRCDAPSNIFHLLFFYIMKATAFCHTNNIIFYLFIHEIGKRINMKLWTFVSFHTTQFRSVFITCSVLFFYLRKKHKFFVL